MSTVSPLADALMAFCTSAEVQVAAVGVVAFATLANKRRRALKNQSCFFMIDALPFQRAHTRGTQCPLHIAKPSIQNPLSSGTVLEQGASRLKHLATRPVAHARTA